MLKPVYRPGDLVVFARASEHERADRGVFVVEEILCDGNLEPYRARVHTTPLTIGNSAFKIVDLTSLSFALIDSNLGDVQHATVAPRCGGAIPDWCWWIAGGTHQCIGPFASMRIALEDIVLWERDNAPKHLHVSQLVEEETLRNLPLPVDDVRRKVVRSPRMSLAKSRERESARRFFEVKYMNRETLLDGTIGAERQDDLRIALIGDVAFHGRTNCIVVEIRDTDAAGNASWRPLPEDGELHRIASYCLVRRLLGRADLSGRLGMIGKIISGERIGQFTFEPSADQ